MNLTCLICPDDPLLTVEEVAERLRVKPETIYNLTRKRTRVRADAGCGGNTPIPHRKLGRELLFSWREVVAWLNTQPGFQVDATDNARNEVTTL